MTIGKRELMAKAKGFVVSIEKMDSKQRALSPSGDFGKDYNRLNDLVSRRYPDLKELLPPVVRVEDSSTMGEFTMQSYAEIRTFCEQILQILGEQPD